VLLFLFGLYYRFAGSLIMVAATALFIVTVFRTAPG